MSPNDIRFAVAHDLGDSKIHNFYDPFLAYHDVSWFEVSMNNSTFLHVKEGKRELKYPIKEHFLIWDHIALINCLPLNVLQQHA